MIALTLIAMQTYGMYSTKLIVPFFKQLLRLGGRNAGAQSASAAALAFLPFMAFVAPSLWDRAMR